MGAENSKKRKNGEFFAEIVNAETTLQYGPNRNSQTNRTSVVTSNLRPQVVLIHQNQSPEFRPAPPPVPKRNISTGNNYNRVSELPPPYTTADPDTVTTIRNFETQSSSSTGANITLNASDQSSINTQHQILSESSLFNQSIADKNPAAYQASSSSRKNYADNSQQNNALGLNEFAWTSDMIDILEKKTSNGKVIDFETELSKIKENIKTKAAASSNDDDFKLMNKELNKNKPIADIRKSLVNNSYMADIIFLINEKAFFGHKIHLTTASPLFHKHFEVDGNREMILDESINPEVFILILSYCYTNQLKLNTENVLEILEVANILEVRQISNICHGFINGLINSESVFSIFEKSIEMNSEEFQKKCLNFITKNEEKCFKSKGFFAIKLDTLMVILEKCNYLSEKVNEVVQKWHEGAMNLVQPEIENAGAQNNAAQPIQNKQKRQRNRKDNKQKPKGNKSNPNNAQPNLQNFPPPPLNFLLQNPNFNPQNLHFLQQNPNFNPQNPNFNPQNPRAQNPFFLAQNSNFHPLNPPPNSNFRSLNPNFNPQNPNFNPQNPNFRPRNPNFNPQNPRAQNPNFRPQNPNLPPQNPKVNQPNPKGNQQTPKGNPQILNDNQQKPKVNQQTPKGNQQNPNDSQQKLKVNQANQRNPKGNPKGNQQNQKKELNPVKSDEFALIPSLMDLEIAPPILDVNQFKHGYGNLIVPIRPFASSSKLTLDDLILCDDDDTESINCGSSICQDDDNDIICFDDDDNEKIKQIIFTGNQMKKATKFSRIDFIAKRSVLLHAIWFTENLFSNTKEVKLNISVVEHGKSSHIHNRVVKNEKSARKLNFINFTRQPLKIYVGQKFFIKLHFSEEAARLHLNPEVVNPKDILELDVKKKYFNCINKIVVSEMA